MTDPLSRQPHTPHVRAPWTLWFGLGLIGVMLALLWLDVVSRDGLVIPYDAPTPDDLPEPDGRLEALARWASLNITPLCWLGYLFAADGLLTLLARYRNAPRISSIRARPNRFVVAWLTSIPVWYFFDWFNFYFMDAWRYHGLPDPFANRLLGYFLAFAAIVPGMLFAAQLYQHLGLHRLRLQPSSRQLITERAGRAAWALLLTPAAITIAWVLLLLARNDDPVFLAFSAALLIVPPVIACALRASLSLVSFVLGLCLLTWTFLTHAPLASFGLWLGLVYFIDPINRWFGAPSLLRDWAEGRFGRTAALLAGGLTCGLLWEFWNYWAIAKWTYHLPFLGPLENLTYFEMPLPGMLGFLPFAAECWIVLNLLIALLEKARLRLAEPLPDEHTIV